MKLPADENVDSAIVNWLRGEGIDVVYVAQAAAACPDDMVMTMARDQGRVLVTSDLDFGEMVYRQRRVTLGVVLLRIRGRSQEERLRMFRAHWPAIRDRAAGSFIVATNRRVRIRPLPSNGPHGR